MKSSAKLVTFLLGSILVSGVLHAQITLTQNFETSTAGSSTPPAGWTLIFKTGSPSYANSGTGLGSNGSGGLSGLAGRVSSTEFVDTDLPGGYLVNSTKFPLTGPVSGSFDFRIENEGTFDDVVFMLGDILNGYDKTGAPPSQSNGTPGELLSVKLTESSSSGVANLISNGYGSLGRLVTNNIPLAHDTWYRATLSWTPAANTTGSFSIAISNFSNNVFTLTVPNFIFASEDGYIGFGSVNDTIRFDNINISNNLAPPPPLPPSSTTPIISLNQIGYKTKAPKRFTAPIAVDGQSFQIVSTAQPSTVLFQGTITGALGDFTAFQPAVAGPYAVSYTPAGSSPAVSSFPFLITPDLLEEKLVKPAIDFMIDSRSGVGTHPSAYGGAPWRDGCYYSFEIPSLIYLHLNARATSNQKTGQIDFNAEKSTVNDPGFSWNSQTGEGDFLNELKSFYNTYEAPLPGCPDALATVHFGLGVTMRQLGGTRDPSGDPLPKHLHSQTREWFAWFLYTWPSIRDHFPDSFYQACRDFTFTNWATSSGLDDTDLGNNQPSPLDIDPLWEVSSYGGHNNHPFKGRHAPGHSILPNLLLWQVALREGRSDANTYLAAAQAQTQWIIANLDWNDPRTTKGHRMSEYKMMTGLVHFLRNHPNEAPTGLAAKIEQWADVMISRSSNMWDFRRYELTDTAGDGVIDWTLPKMSANWNEPGNLAGFPACALAAAWTLDKAPAKQQRLREMSQSALDCLFGRNPLNTGSASRPQLGFPDQETNWTPLYTGKAAFLEGVRGALSSGPGSEHFPYNPGASIRWNEGWVNFNAAWNMGLSYMLADESPNPDPLAAPFPLVISEILATPVGNSLAEFIELHNPTNESVRLSGLRFTGDVTLTLAPATANLAPGARALVVRDLTAFHAVHGIGLPVVGSYTGDLDDAGSTLHLGDVNGNIFLSLNRSILPSHPGHSQTLGQSGWRISANGNGSPGISDSIPFADDPTGDTNQDGTPNLIHHAVTGMDRAYIAPQIDLAGPGVVVRVTRNIAADDTNLTLEWCDDLIDWHNVGPPATVTPNGDRLAEWFFTWPTKPTPFFIRLRAID